METGILSFLIGVAIGLQYSKILHRKWRAKHTCGPVTIEVHGGGGWGGSGLQNQPGGFSDMTGGHGGASTTPQSPPITMKNGGASS